MLQTICYVRLPRADKAFEVRVEYFFRDGACEKRDHDLAEERHQNDLWWLRFYISFPDFVFQNAFEDKHIVRDFFFLGDLKHEIGIPVYFPYDEQRKSGVGEHL